MNILRKGGLANFKMLFGIGLVLSVVGCARSPTIEYYILTPAVANEPTPYGGNVNLVAVVTPSIPRYIDRDEIVERLSGNKVFIHEYRRWAADLDMMLRDYLIDALNQQIGSVNFVSSDAKIARRAGAQWEGTFTRFDIYRAERIELELTWQLRATENAPARRHFEIRVSESLPNDSIESIIKVLNQSLGRVAAEVAQSIRALNEPAAS